MRVFLVVMFALACSAQAEQLVKRPTFFVKPQASVRGEAVYLQDIASFNGGETEFGNLTDALKQIRIGDAPPPKMKEIVTGARILEIIQAAGLPAESFGYTIPRAVTIEREGRTVTPDEVLSALRTRLWSDKELEVQPRGVIWSNEQIVPVGETRIEVEPLGEATAGKMPLRVEVLVENRPAARFLATAAVDDWREVPVLKRSLDRGMLVSAEDFEVVRLNVTQQPADIIDDAERLIGRRTKGRIEAGETVRKSAVDLPPVIPKGTRVTVVYRFGGLTASASGTALEDGFEDGGIRVRNESSKKVIEGRVAGEGLVEVSPENSE